MTSSKDFLPRWLHRRGIARTLSSTSSNSHPDVQYLMESRRWTPRWLVVWAANRNFSWMYRSQASQLHLADVRKGAVAQDGSRRWTLQYRPTL
ncbi:hypothetical protein ACF07S_10405 [Streptomyces sp. NPDC016640]|uniref:hypothetical protein n=1 Tax=Streptomyces sp. NPDC016640 TaxID=3364969 RepID=UPI0036FBE751